MDKRLIKLSESDLHKIVKESVNKVLTELDWRTYANAAKKRDAQIQQLGRDATDKGGNRFLELRANPHGELKGNVFVGVCAAITSSLRDDSYGIGFLRPFFCTETETIQSGLRFNYVEFGTIKIRIHQPLPDSKELDGIAIAEPIGKEEFTILSLQHVCQADVVIVVLLNDRYLRILYYYLCHIVCRITNFALQS